LQADEVAGLGGNDQITGTDRVEVLAVSYPVPGSA
jgi:hypothetical protein